MYMLDTNICIYIRKQSPPHVLKKLETYRIGDVCMSAITFAELMYRCRKSQAIKTNLDKLQALRLTGDTQKIDTKDKQNCNNSATQQATINGMEHNTSTTTIYTIA